jgi:uncharacterized protein
MQRWGVDMARIARWLLLALLTAISGCSPAQQAPADPAVKQAVEDLKQQAEKGDPVAQWRLGSLYDSGQGVPRDGKEAEKWYRRAADNGYAEAQNSLGSFYQAERKYSEAVEWYRKAADQGHTLALNNLAYVYDLGLGVSQDREHAFELYMKAANQGDPRTMFNIANVYGAGKPSAENLRLTYVWLLRAQRYETNCFVHDSTLANRIAASIRYVERALRPDEVGPAWRTAASWSAPGTCH